MTIALAVQVGGAHNEVTVCDSFCADLYQAIQETLSTGEIISMLSIPSGVAVEYRLENTGDASASDGILDVAFTVTLTPEMVELLSPGADLEIGQFVFDRLNGISLEKLRSGMASNPPRLRLRPFDENPMTISSSLLAARSGFSPDENRLGWSKGCNSWPW